MAYELYNTSAPRGLKPGSTGFCTVALTGGMSPPMIHRLESLSGYEAIHKVGSPDADKNPVEHAHWRPAIGGQTYSVLSLVRFAGADFTSRNNRLAYHLLLEPSEHAPGGPAWLLKQPGVVSWEWSGEPRVLPAPKKLPAGPEPAPRSCETWARVTGDAGWAGVLAEAFLLNADRPVYLLYELGKGADLLDLIDEATRLLPVHLRWRVTFSTYFRTLPAGLSCAWRCCVAGSDAALGARGSGATIVDLTSALGPAPTSKYVVAAQTGTLALEPDGSDAGLRRPAAALRTATTEPTSPPPATDKPAPLEILDEDSDGRRAVRRAPASGHPERRDHVARPNSRSLWLAVAIAWPVLVLAIGAAVLKSGSSTNDGTLRAREADVERLHSELDKVQKRTERLEVELGTERARADQADQEARKAKKEIAEERATSEGLKRRVTELDAERERARTAAQAAEAPDTSSEAPTATQSAEPHATGLPIARQVADGCWYVPYPRLEVDDRTSRFPPSTAKLILVGAATVVRLNLPPRADHLRTVGATVVYATEKPRVAVGGQKLFKKDLATAYIESGVLMWGWKDVALSAEFLVDDLREARDALEYATLGIEGVPSVRLVQMVACDELTLKLGADEHVMTAAKHPWDLCDPRLEIASPPTRWGVKSFTARRLALEGAQDVNVAFSIEPIGKKDAAIKVTSDFAEGLRRLEREHVELQTRRGDLTGKIAAYEKDHPKWEERLRAVDGEIQQKKKHDARLEEERQTILEHRQRIAQRDEVAANAALAIAKLSALLKLGGFRLQVIAGSDAILANVNVIAFQAEKSGGQ